jgi:ubiquinone/menaquinone biosynthesis C-methylase UbiE
MTDTTMQPAHGDHLDEVRSYFGRRESRWGYRLLLRGRKHFGYYPPDTPGLSIAEAQQLMEDQLAARLDVDSGSRVLDAGSGEGVVSTYLARRYGYRMVGIDLLMRNAPLARANALRGGVRPLVDCMPASYLDIPLASGSVDAAFTMETLVHSPDAAATLAEIHRVLRPGGRLVCAEYTTAPPDEMDERCRRMMTDIALRGTCPGMLDFRNGAFGDHVEAAGFVDVRVDDLSAHIEPLLRIFDRLARGPYWIARRLGLTAHVLNAQTGVEWYRYRQHWRYVMATATKPDFGPEPRPL